MGNEDATVPETGPPAHPPEPHPLDLWFLRQRTAWWKKWRWAVWLLVVVITLKLACDIAEWIITTRFDPSNASQHLAFLAVFLMDVYIATFQLHWFSLLLLLACNLILIAWGKMLTNLPEDLEIALPPAEFRRKQWSLLVRHTYLLYGCLLILPGLISSLAPRLIYVVQPGFNAALALVWLLATAEIMIWLLLRYPQVHNLVPSLIPVGTYALMMLLLRTRSYFNYDPLVDTAKSWLLNNIAHYCPIFVLLAVAIFLHVITRRYVRQASTHGTQPPL